MTKVNCVCLLVSILLIISASMGLGCSRKNDIRKQLTWDEKWETITNQMPLSSVVQVLGMPSGVCPNREGRMLFYECRKTDKKYTNGLIPDVYVLIVSNNAVIYKNIGYK